MSSDFMRPNFCEEQFYMLATHGENIPDGVIYARMIFDNLTNVNKMRNAISNTYYRYKGFHYTYSIHRRHIVKKKIMKNLALEEMSCQEESIDRCIHDFFSAPLNVSADKDSLCYFLLIKSNSGQYNLLIKASHLAIDAFSFKKMVDDIGADYSDKAVEDFSCGADKVEISDSNLYWEQFLTECDAQYNVPSISNSSHDCFDKVHLILDDSISKDIFRKMKRKGISPMIYISWAFSLAVSRNIHQNKIGFVHPVSLHKNGISDSCLVNQLPMNIDFTGQKTITDQLEITKLRFKKNLKNKYYPFSNILKKIAPESIPGKTVPYSIAINPTIIKCKLNSFSNIDVTLLSYNEQNLRPLTLNYDYLSNREYILFFNKSIYPENIVSNIMIDFESILKNACNILEQKINPSLYESDIYSFANHGINKDLNFRFFDKVTKYAQDTPSATAFIDGRKTISYNQLNIDIDKLCQMINAKCYQKLESVKNNKTILAGVYFDKSYEQVVAMLSCIKMNIGYVPLDKHLPFNRLKDIIATTQPFAIISDLPSLDFVNSDVDVINISSVECIFQEQQENIIQYDLSRTAYVIPTSGSTGKPKVISMSYLGLNNMTLSLSDYFKFTDNDCMLSYSSAMFDTSTCEIFPTLYSGSQVCIPSERDKTDIDSLIFLVNKCNVTHAMLTPSLLWLMRPDHIKNIEHIILMGEKFDISLVKKITDSKVNCHNLYGPSESNACTVTMLYPDEYVHLGDSFYNCVHMVLDQFGIPIRPGSIGELAIIGYCLSDGYIDGDNSAFVEIDFHHLHNRAYLSKDLVFRDQNKNIVYIGRLTSEVKINGFRVDLKEIESATQSIKEGVLCAVLVKKTKSGSIIRAFISGLENVTESDLKSVLGTKLPYYMIPHQVIFMDIPLNKNKKIDYKLLDVVKYSEQQLTVSNFSFENLSDIERNILTLWESILDVKMTSLDSNFFHLGGDSLSAINLTIELSEMYSMHISTSFVYEYPTISTQAENLIIHRNSPEMRFSKLSNAVHTDKTLFMVHPTAAGSEIYYKIARHFKDKINVIGINSYNLNNPSNPVFEIEKLAEIYGAYIVSYQTDGPYYLSGWSSGGNFAFAVAEYLVSIGKSVSGIFMLDSFNFEKHSLNIFSSDFEQENTDWYDLYINEQLDNKGISDSYLDKLKTIAAFEKKSIIGRMFDSTKNKIDCEITLYKAMKSHNFKIIKLKTNQPESSDLLSDNLLNISDNGWNGLSRDLRVINISDNHVGLVNTPSTMAKISSDIIKIMNN